MELNDFILHFAEQFEETDPKLITANCEFQELEEWSSMTLLSIIVFIKKKYNKTITAREIRTCVTVQDFFELVQSKQ